MTWLIIWSTSPLLISPVHHSFAPHPLTAAQPPWVIPTWWIIKKSQTPSVWAGEEGEEKPCSASPWGEMLWGGIMSNCLPSIHPSVHLSLKISSKHLPRPSFTSQLPCFPGSVTQRGSSGRSWSADSFGGTPPDGTSLSSGQEQLCRHIWHSVTPPSG